MAPHRTRAGRRSAGAAYELVLGLVVRPGPPLSAAQIYQELRRVRGDDTGLSLRTVQRILQEIGTDGSGDWSLAITTDEQAALVTPVLADVIESTLGATRSITRAEAEAIVKIRRAAPDLEDLAQVYMLARFSIARPGPDLDEYIAFAPWRDDGRRYDQAYAMGWIDDHWNLNYERADRVLDAELAARQADQEAP